jgi:hypothetical protein
MSNLAYAEYSNDMVTRVGSCPNARTGSLAVNYESSSESSEESSSDVGSSETGSSAKESLTCRGSLSDPDPFKSSDSSLFHGFKCLNSTHQPVSAGSPAADCVTEMSGLSALSAHGPYSMCRGCYFESVQERETVVGDWSTGGLVKSVELNVSNVQGHSSVNESSGSTFSSINERDLPSHSSSTSSHTSWLILSDMY